MDRSCTFRPTPQPQQLGIRAASVTYTTAHGNARSLTSWARPGIEPASLWELVRFVSAEPGTPLSGPSLPGQREAGLLSSVRSLQNPRPKHGPGGPHPQPPCARWETKKLDLSGGVFSPGCLLLGSGHPCLRNMPTTGRSGHRDTGMGSGLVAAPELRGPPPRCCHGGGVTGATWPIRRAGWGGLGPHAPAGTPPKQR